MKSQIKFLFAILILFSVTSCGTNIFEGFVEENDDINLSDALDEATSVEDYNEIIEDADSIINSDAASDTDKADAYKAKSEAILGSIELSPIDIFSDLNDSATSGDNPLSVLDLDVDNAQLIESANAIASANALDSDSTDDEDLLKGVVNTMVVVNTIDEALSISDDGEITQVNEDQTYWETLTDVMYPDDNNTSVTIADYAENAYDGYEDSDSLSSEQLSDLETTSEALTEVESLFSAITNGTSYTDPSGNTVTYPALSTDESASDEVNEFIETQLGNIFQDMTQ
tara:strand:- start:522 stop:1379 length:858 start_codon:yes stop_codon:yes gene_type:complete